MSKPKEYRVTKDGTTVLQQYATRTNRKTGEVFHLNRANVYNEGDIVSEDKIAPNLLESIKSGESNIALDEVKTEAKKPAKKSATKSRTTTSKKNSKDE